MLFREVCFRGVGLGNLRGSSREPGQASGACTLTLTVTTLLSKAWFGKRQERVISIVNKRRVDSFLLHFLDAVFDQK